MRFTRKGYIEVYRPDGTLVSRHTTAEEAYESAVSDFLAGNSDDPTYTVAYPRREIDMGSLKRTYTFQPTAPVLTASASGSSSIDVSWTASNDVGGVAGYQLYRSTDNTTWGTAIYDGAQRSSSNPYSDSGRVASTKYYYRVRAYDAAGNFSDYGTAQATTTASGGVFVPDIHKNYDGYQMDDSVDRDTGIPAIKWYTTNGSPAWDLGCGTRITTAIARPGKTSCMELRIRQNSFGNDEDSAVPDGGPFGGYHLLPNNSVMGEGEELWVGYWIYLPLDWSWDSVTGGASAIKTLRLPRPDGGKVDLETCNGRRDYIEAGDPAVAPSLQSGWFLSPEGNPFSYYDAARTSSEKMVLGQWNWVEWYTKLSATPANAVSRVWVNGVFAFEVADQTATFRDWSGTIRTQTLGKGYTPLLTSSGTITRLMVFTYWNGTAPQDQSCYIQDIVMHANPATVPNVDEFGNKMIGMGTI